MALLAGAVLSLALGKGALLDPIMKKKDAVAIIAFPAVPALLVASLYLIGPTNKQAMFKTPISA